MIRSWFGFVLSLSIFALSTYFYFNLQKTDSRESLVVASSELKSELRVLFESTKKSNEVSESDFEKWSSKLPTDSLELASSAHFEVPAWMNETAQLFTDMDNLIKSHPNSIEAIMSTYLKCAKRSNVIIPVRAVCLKRYEMARRQVSLQYRVMQNELPADLARAFNDLPDWQ